MSHESDETRLAALAHQAQEARTRVIEDVEALAYKLSPENLKREALEVSRGVAAEVSSTVERWADQTNAVAREHWVELSLTVGFSGLLYAGLVKRNRGLIIGGLTCGVGVVAALFLRSNTHRNNRLLAAPSA